MKTPSPRPALWNVPYRRNPFFTGREDILQYLHQALHAECAVALSHPQGISGLGGIGKTQTAAEYAYRHREEYDAVFWLRADSVTSLTSSIVEMAQLLDLPERNEQDQDIIVQAVLRWLRVHRNWLLIYDNIDDLSLVERFLPQAGAGHLLFTTRAHALGGLAQRLDIQQMEPEIGALLLLRRAGLLALQATLNMATPDEQRLAQAISRELDGLPLALDQAGAYIKEIPCLLSDYLTRYQARRSDLLRLRGRFEQDYPASVATTWSLSFEKVGQIHPAAPELLNFCAFLAPEAIPEELLTTGAAHFGDIPAPVVTDPLQFDQVCKDILRFSLLQREADERTLTIHRLVQAVLRANLSTEAQQQWVQRAVDTVAVATMTYNEEAKVLAGWSTLEHLLPHALICATWIEQVPLRTCLAAGLLEATGSYLGARAQYSEAETLLKRALTICEQISGAAERNLLHSRKRAVGQFMIVSGQLIAFAFLSTFGQLLVFLYNFGQLLLLGGFHPISLSINILRRPPTPAVFGREELLLVSTSLNNLADLYILQQRCREAEALLKRALAIRERVLEANHPDTATILSNLALLYFMQQRFKKAEPLLKRALAICERVLGARHPYTASSLVQLANLYSAQEKYRKAEPLLKRALAIREQVEGANHPRTARSLDALAFLYRAQGRYGEAETLFKRALTICEQTLGMTHPETAQSLDSLALLYITQERYKEAEPLCQRALATCDQQLSRKHPTAQNVLANSSSLLRAVGRDAEAKQLEADLVRESVFSVVKWRQDHLKKLVKKFTELPVLQRALSICEQRLGPDHPGMATSLNNLAGLYRDQGQYAKAEPLYQRALAICEQQLGPEHPDMATILNNLALLYTAQGKYAEAAPLYRHALSIQEQQLGLDHPNIANTLHNLAQLCMIQMRYEEARHLLERALAICERTLGRTHPRTQVTLQRYDILSRIMGHRR